MTLLRNLLFLIIAFLLIGIAGVAEAAGTTANAVITFPTTYSGGQTLPATDVASWSLQWSYNGAQQQTITAPATATSVQILCGSVTFTATVTTSSTAAFPNLTSPPSAAVSYDTGITCKPGAPILKVS